MSEEQIALKLEMYLVPRIKNIAQNIAVQVP